MFRREDEYSQSLRVRTDKEAFLHNIFDTSSTIMKVGQSLNRFITNCIYDVYIIYTRKFYPIFL